MRACVAFRSGSRGAGTPGGGGGGGKTESIVILGFPLFCSVWGSQDTQMPGKAAQKSVIVTPFLCAPNAGEN